MSALAPTLQAFFTERLARQRQASPHTVAAYRDAMRLLVRFAAERHGIEPTKLDIGDVDATLISAFLDDRERHRGNSVRTRNARLAAIRSLFRYAALRHPEHAAVFERVLAIPRNASSDASSRSSRIRRSRRSSPRRIGPRGPADAITPCSRSPCRRGSACRS